MFELRPADANDRELRWLVQCRSMRPYVEATWGWDESFQREYFHRHYDERSCQIMSVDGTNAGVLAVEIHPDQVFLKTVALLPEFQGRGIGTEVIRHVIDQALRLGVSTRLQVLKVNPARRLYERLGFRMHAETATHFLMVFEPLAARERPRS